MKKDTQKVNPIENPDFGKTISFNGKSYKLVDLSAEAHKIINEIVQVQKSKVEASQAVLRIEGIESYLNAKLGELLPKTSNESDVDPLIGEVVPK